jgi:threonine dehydrogenase-like Zn-dependent dehydrogenase
VILRQIAALNRRQAGVTMKTVVIGGTGLIGSKTVAILRHIGLDEWLRRSRAGA